MFQHSQRMMLIHIVVLAVWRLGRCVRVFVLFIKPFQSSLSIIVSLGEATAFRNCHRGVVVVVGGVVECLGD